MKDDKKKMMVVGALALVIVAVGAFQFLGGSTPPPAAKTAKKDDAKAGDKTADAAEEGPKNPLYAAELPQRDPFQPHTLVGETPKAPNVPAAGSTPLPDAKASRRGHRGGGTSIPPMTITGNLPNAGMNGSIGITPTGPDPSAFNYSVSGVIVGQRPAAVFTDSQGNQRLVPVGGSLDGDSKVVAIEKGQVTVQYRNKTLRLSLGGNPK